MTPHSIDAFLSERPLSVTEYAATAAGVAVLFGYGMRRGNLPLMSMTAGIATGMTIGSVQNLLQGTGRKNRPS